MIGNYRRLTVTQLRKLIAHPDLVPGFLSENSPGAHLEIGQTWHAIHYLLTGSVRGGDPPLRNAVLGGTRLDATRLEDSDLGGGPVRYLTPAEVLEAARALLNTPPEDLAARYDGLALTSVKIYPGEWDVSEQATDLIRGHYERLAAIFFKAAQVGNAILIYLSRGKA